MLHFYLIVMMLWRVFCYHAAIPCFRFLQCKSMTAGVPSHRFSRIPVMNSGTSTGLQMALLRTRWCIMGESSACQLRQYRIWSYDEVFRQFMDTYVFNKNSVSKETAVLHNKYILMSVFLASSFFSIDWWVFSQTCCLYILVFNLLTSHT